MRFGPALPLLLGGVLTLSACVATTGDPAGVAVSSKDEACVLSSGTAPSGTITFTVTNDGSDVTEFSLLAADGLRVISELENIGPGLTRDLVVQLAAGDYIAACKPGLVGDGIRSDFLVTDSGTPIATSGDRAAQRTEASEQYRLYVRDQVGTLAEKTDEFLEAYLAGDDELARALYADTRVHWERIEPVAEAFGDLDPSMDAREADLIEGEPFTGWHHIEKTLWPPLEGYSLSADERRELADQLAEDTATLFDRVHAADFRIEPFQIGNTAKELLDELASGKVTGEEEFWSHTDLWGFQANLDGAWAAFSVLRPIVEQTDPALVEEIDRRFGELNALLAQHGSIEDGFAFYDTLSPAEVLDLARAVDALGEPLSRLTAAAIA